MEDEGSANELAQLDRALPPLLPLDSDLQMERVLAGRSHGRYHRRRHARPAGDPSLSLKSIMATKISVILVSVWMMRKWTKRAEERISYSIYSTKLDSCFMIIFFFTLRIMKLLAVFVFVFLSFLFSCDFSGAKQSVL